VDPAARFFLHRQVIVKSLPKAVKVAKKKKKKTTYYLKKNNQSKIIADNEVEEFNPYAVGLQKPRVFDTSNGLETEVRLKKD
jgi:uncharacterized membrane protein YvbJ